MLSEEDMDKKLLEELNINEEKKDKIKIALKLELSEIDQKLSFLDDDNPKVAELKNLYSRIEKAIEDLDKEETSIKKNEKEEWLPKEKDMTVESLPKEKGKEKKSVSDISQNLKDKLPVFGEKESEHEKELKRKAKEELLKNKLEQTKKQILEPKKTSSETNTDNVKNNPQISNDFVEGMKAYSMGNYPKAINLFHDVIIHYDNTKENREEAGEASYMLSKMYGDKTKGTYDAEREKFYLKKSAEELYYPEGMLDYGIVLASKLSSMPKMDDSALKLFQKVIENDKVSKKTKNTAKLKFVETCERYKGFKKAHISKAVKYCNDLASLEREPYLKKDWENRGNKLKKEIKGKASFSFSNIFSNVFSNIVSGILLIIVLLMGNIGFHDYMRWEPGFDFIFDRLPAPFLAEEIRLENAGGVFFSFSPFHKDVTLFTEEQIKIYMPFSQLEYFYLNAEEAENINVPKANGVTLSVPNAKKIEFSDNIYSVTISDLEQMSEITIPEGVETVSLRDCSSLVSVNLPSSVNTFEVRNCYNLRNVNTTNQISNSTIFYNNYEHEATSIQVPNGIQTATIQHSGRYLDSIVIGKDVQNVNIQVKGLTSLEMPSTVENIDLHCEENLYSLTLPESIISAVVRIPSLQEFIPNNGIQKLELTGMPGITKFTVPETVTELQVCDCDNLTTLVIPTARGIGIHHCPNLSSVVLPEGTTFDDITIYDCPTLGF